MEDEILGAAVTAATTPWAYAAANSLSTLYKLINTQTAYLIALESYIGF